MPRNPVTRPGVAGATAAAVAVAVVVGLTGCQGGTTSPAPTPVHSSDLTSSDGGFDRNAVVGVVLQRQRAGATSTPSSSPDDLAARFRSALTDAGFRPDVRIPSTADQAAAQRTAVHALVRAGAKAVLVDAADPESLAGQVQYAHDAGVVVVALGDPLPGTAASTDGGVSADYRVLGGSDAQTVARAVAVVESLQRGERPTGPDVTAR